MIRNSRQLKVGASILVLGTFVAGCGGSSSSSSSADEGVELSGGLASLPSMSSMLAANEEVSSSSWNPFAVSGTAPLLKTLSASNVDTYFFDGALANLENWSGLTNGQKLTTARNYRGLNGYAGGQGACRMAQETGAVFDRMLNNGTSACYMKKIPSAVGAPADTFAQGTEDKLVRVHVTNMSHGGDDDGPSEMYVNIKVFGSNNAGAGNYKAQLFFCAGTSGSPIGQQGLETFEFNKSTGVYSMTSIGETHNAQATAYLKKVGDSILVDVSKDRTATFQDSHGGFDYKAEVTITGDNKVYNKAYGSGSWGSNRNYSVASFTGASMDDLRFTAGAFKGRGESTGCTYWNGSATVACDPWSYEGGTEFQDSLYKSTTSSSLYSELASVDLISDSFYAAPSIASADLSGLDCGATAAATIEMDFSTEAVAAAKAECEGDRLFDNQASWQMCEGGRENEHQIWQYLFEN